MKVIATIALFVLAGSVQAQSLKDALYGGRLKNDTGAVIKKNRYPPVEGKYGQKGRR